MAKAKKKVKEKPSYSILIMSSQREQLFYFDCDSPFGIKFVFDHFLNRFRNGKNVICFRYDGDLYETVFDKNTINWVQEIYG